MPKGKKKFLDFHNPMTIVSIVAICGALGTAVVGMARYITLPETVEAQEKRISDIEKYTSEQRVSNQIQQQILDKIVDKVIGEDEVMLSPDERYWWDNDSEKWRPISELKGRTP